MNKFLLKNPIITEKSAAMGHQGKYVFLVDARATAPEVKKIVEQVYKVKVTGTNTLNVKDKKRRLGMSVGVKPGYKKMVVTLQKGQKLDILPQ